VNADIRLEVRGQISEASNATFFCVDSVSGKEYVYKPVRGERPLWDFLDQTLTGREIAASELDKLLNWNLIPLTQWIFDGPFGEGMIQEWIPEIDTDRPVNLFSPNSVPPEWINVLQGQTQDGDLVVLAHADSEPLKKLALFDAVANNADRKAGHVLAVSTERFFGIDHGVCFHEENKLRTVIWGWAGTPIAAELIVNLKTCASVLEDDYEPIDMWLSPPESAALRARLENLITTELYPLPSPHWPAIPWPVF
jgi:uncharacterized repeat protein (TIGR03843 family)